MNLILQTWSDERMATEIANADWGATVHLVPITLALVGGVALLAIVWSAINMFKNPAGLKKFGIGLLILAALAVVAYFMSGGPVPENLQGMVSNNVYHWVGTGILLTGILIAIGLLILIYDLVRGLFKV